MTDTAKAIGKRNRFSKNTEKIAELENVVECKNVADIDKTVDYATYSEKVADYATDNLFEGTY